MKFIRRFINPSTSYSPSPKQSNRIREHINIIRITRHTSPIINNHTLTPNRTQRININIPRILHIKNLALAVLRAPAVRTRSAVVVEEAVEAGAVDEDVLAVQDAEAPCVAVPGGCAG